MFLQANKWCIYITRYYQILLVYFIVVNWAYAAEDEEEVSVRKGEVVGIIENEAKNAKNMCHVNSIQ